MGFIIRLLITAAALWVAEALVPGIEYRGGIGGLLGVALIFGLVNAIVRPILVVLTCPLVLLTLGLFLFVLNAFLLWLTGALSGALGIDFHVQGFWAALLGGIVIGLVSTVLNVFVGKEGRKKE
ncbi:MAG TPA: phage holin family protein [Longimicrobiales bacterium]|nr:phage holin family protein [Longimicrobiales bacterium]